ncbi:MAG TPA: carboxypeptidase regulatory-like domain-containing protein [Candidatus Angelobacter sp.]|nr:carboxypeptidase regulatory-like domain-containing protein [Candidatus Angelobacter sp.]
MKFWPAVIRTTFFITIFMVGILRAQAQDVRLHGQVADPSGAVIPQATILVKNAAGKVITAQSDGLGTYTVKGLAQGKYVITVMEKGFAPSTQEVELTAGQDKKLDIKLEIAVQEQQVEVQSDAAKVNVNPENNASSLVISGKDLDALSDDPDELQSELQALAGPSAGPNGGQIYIDGFTGGQLPPKSSIREIRINQNPFSAQYDRIGYGRIEILTKPGTDKVHGQVSFTDNHSIFDALNPFAAGEPGFDSQIFNGNIGGPLSKKASYFFNFERRDIHDAAVILPQAFSAAQLGVTPVLNPRIRTNVNARLDYQLTTNNTLTARYQFTDNNEQNDGIGGLTLPSVAYNQNTTEHSIQISDSQVLSPRAVNETRFEWERGNNTQASLNSAPTQNVLDSFVTGGNSLGTSSVISNHYEIQNYTSYNKGKHFMRFGGRLRVTAESSLSTQNFNGSYTFTSPQAFANKAPSQLVLTFGNPLVKDTFADVGVYAEDDWKIRPNMTLSYGLRYETQNGISDHGDWAPRLGFAWGLGGKKDKPPKTVIRTGFGLFYDRFNQNLIIQTERLNNITQQQFTVIGNSAATQSALQNFFTSGTLPTQSQIQGIATTGAAYQIDPALRAPYTEQAAISVEQQLSKISTLSVTYLHSYGVHQFFLVNNAVQNAIQQGVFDPIHPPAPAYQYESEGIFKQNQLITSFNIRLGARLSLFSYYSLSFANGDTAGAGSSPSNPLLGITADYGRTAFDVRNRFFFGGTIGLPHGFRISPFIVANSGLPFNITLGSDANGDSFFNDRPAFATSATVNPVVNQFGSFDLNPGANEQRIPVNFGTTPALFTANVRLSKTFGIGPKVEAPAGNQQGENRGGNRGPGGPLGGGDRGRGGPGGIFGGERSNQRYSLTFSANARNLFNNVNTGLPVGNLSSPLFGTFTSLAGGVFNTQSANRRVDFQVAFAF